MGRSTRTSKLIKAFKLFIYNIHCKFILFGGPTDKRHMRLLGPYISNKAIKEKITLMEGPPFANEMVQLASVFGKVSLRDMFRDTKIPPCATVLPKSRSSRALYAAVVGTASSLEHEGGKVALVFTIRNQNPTDPSQKS